MKIMALQPIKGMTAAEMRTEAALYRSLADHASEPEVAQAYRAVAEQIDSHAEVAARAEADAVDAYLDGVSSADLSAALERRLERVP